MAIAGKDAQIYLSDAEGQSTSMTDESMDEISAALDLWQISDASKNIFNPEFGSWVIEADAGGGFQDVTADADIRFLVGAVVATTPDFGLGSNPNAVRITGEFLPKHSILEGTTSTIDIERSSEEIPQFQDQGQRRIYTLFDISVEWEQFEVLDRPIDGQGGTSDSLGDILKSSGVDPLRVFSYQPEDDENNLYRAWMKEESISVEGPADGVQGATVSWVSSENETAQSGEVAQPFDILRY